MVERPCELQDKVQCNTDQHSFKGYMHRSLAMTAIVAPFTRTDILRVLRSSTQGAVESCLSDGTCGFRWNTGSYDGDVASGPAGQQMSALAALSTLLLEEKNQGPLTTETGGTSQGDPNAGGEPVMLPPPPVTTGWRAGAGVLTAVVLASMVGGLVWISGEWSEGA